MDFLEKIRRLLDDHPSDSVSTHHDTEDSSSKLSQVYHFTDRRNLASIVNAGGIMPLCDIDTLGLDVAAYSSNLLSRQLDRRRGFDRYVSLCFIADNPMAHIARRDGRISDPVYLAIHGSVLSRPGVKIYNNFAVCRDARRISLAQAQQSLNHDSMSPSTANSYTPGDRYDSTRRYEILVPGPIPLDLITFPA